MQVPRLIWISGLPAGSQPSPVMQLCIGSWARANPGWEVRPIQGEAGASLLSEHGGVWVDPTVFCAVPLDEWLAPVMAGGFFAFDAHRHGGPTEWFVAAARQHPLVRRWDDRATTSWTERARETTANVPSEGGLFFSPYVPDLLAPMAPKQLLRLFSERDPVYKLTADLAVSAASSRSAYAYFSRLVDPPDSAVPGDRLRDSLVRFGATGGRILLHAGAPKTGSTALQRTLHENRQRLLEHGICYSRDISLATADPKHQWLVFTLRLRDLATLEDRLAGAVDEAVDGGATTLVLSSEGIYNQWLDYESWAASWFRAISDVVTLELWLVLREPIAYVSALYQQFLRNSQMQPPPNGLAESAAQMLTRPSVHRRLDYNVVVAWWEDVLGTDHVHADTYTYPIASVVCERLGIYDLPWNGARDNPSLSGAGCALMRLVNAWQIPDDDRQRIIDHVFAIDETVTEAIGRQPTLSEGEQQLVAELMGPSVARLVGRRPELAALTPQPVLDPPPPEIEPGSDIGGPAPQPYSAAVAAAAGANPVRPEPRGHELELGNELRKNLQRLSQDGGRLVLHGGSMKTGSTSMQNVFDRQRDVLSKHGICYPSNVSPPEGTKHQWIVNQLLTRDIPALERMLNTAVEEALAGPATTVLISTEGLYSYWSDYQAWAGPWFRRLAEVVPVSMWMLLREPVGFTAGCYQQVLRSPRIWRIAHRQPVTPAAALQTDALLRRLDYNAVVSWWEDVLGRENVRVDVYTPSLAPLVRQVLGVPDLEWDADRANSSITGYGCTLLARLTVLRLPEDARLKVTELVTTIDTIARQAAGPAPIFGPEDVAFVRNYTRSSIERLVSRRPELSPLLS